MHLIDDSQLNKSMHLKQNAELQNGKYRIARALGQGGFGITYLAENILLGNQVAIKEFFSKDYCGRNTTSHLTLGTESNRETVAKLKDRFLKEARNIAKLDHPGIVRVFDVFEENDTAYYVMEYIHGENLNEIVKQNGPLPEDKAIKYVTEVGSSLEYIHSKNMTHFDVKPANIIIRKKDDLPILIDFGLSKQYDSKGDATSTMMQAVSHGYSPIELYNAGAIQVFSPQTDVYSLGATLYYLVTGAVPPHASVLIDKGIYLSNSFSKSLQCVIIQSMKISRERRIKSISDFIKLLTNPESSIETQQIIHNPKISMEESSGYINYNSPDVEDDDRTFYCRFLDRLCGDRQWARDLVTTLILVGLVGGVFLLKFL
ncbi:MAG: serine/threonine protein kinase [Muribaculaceae bacterium]|nr:serine/threonine protein kinase [Muribaculaceae bacterium]